MIKLRTILTLFIIVSLMVGVVIFLTKYTFADNNLNYVYEYKENIEVELLNRNPETYYGVTDQGEELYFCFTEAVGYQSSIEMMTVINDEGHIDYCQIIKQGETPAFYERLIKQKFPAKFPGLPIGQAIYLRNAPGYVGNDEQYEEEIFVEAISGATISSVAITKAVNEATLVAGKEYFNLSGKSPYEAIDFGLDEVGLILILAIAILDLYVKTIKKYRKWILMYTAIVVGFYINKFITFGILFSFAMIEWPGFNNLSWYILLFGTMMMILLTGKNIYCRWMCPFGAVQEVILKFGGLKTIKIKLKYVKILRWIRVILAYFAIMIVLLTNTREALAYDPFSALFNLTAGSIMWMTLPILVFISLVQYRFYCTYFCPIGYTLDLLCQVRKYGVNLWKRRRVNQS